MRILSATNRDLSQAVAVKGVSAKICSTGWNVFSIEAPALRERREDIPALTEVFVRRFNLEEGRRVAGASPETLAMLSRFDWPGNVRQLENAVYRAIILADAPFLQPHDFPAISGLSLPAQAAEPASGPSIPMPTGPLTLADLTADLPKTAPVQILDERGHLRTLEDIERDLIQLAIEIYAGHMSEVARRLGIGRSTLYRKVREQGLEDQIKEAV